MSQLNPDVLVVVHCYSGDRQQVIDLLPVYQHHQAPIVIVSPDDSPVTGIGPHICRTAGKRAYIGQLSWDRQYEQLKALLDYPQKWFLLNDADSFVIPAKLPDYLLEDENTVWSNEVNDFRIPGQTWPGVDKPWPLDYHKGFPLIAMQPPYFLHRKALEAIVAKCKGMKADPITPFIDWWWVPACYKAHVKHKPFRTGASCETVTPLGVAVMSERIVKYKASFIHSVKSGAVMNQLVDLYHTTHGRP